MDFKTNDIVIGNFYRRPVRWKIDMIAHNIVYYLDQNVEDGHGVLNKMKLDKFTSWAKKNCTKQIRSGKKV